MQQLVHECMDKATMYMNVFKDKATINSLNHGQGTKSCSNSVYMIMEQV